MPATEASTGLELAPSSDPRPAAVAVRAHFPDGSTSGWVPTKVPAPMSGGADEREEVDRDEATVRVFMEARRVALSVEGDVVIVHVAPHEGADPRSIWYVRARRDCVDSLEYLEPMKKDETTDE